MSHQEITEVCVVGAGTMGRQIALNTALHGYQVTLYDVDPAALRDATVWVGDYLRERVARGRLTSSDSESALGRLRTQDDVARAVESADLVIEAATEDLQVKRRIFAELDRTAKPSAILATNSSTIGSSKLAGATGRPGKVANLHYFNPALVMQAVEVVQGDHTDEATVQTLLEFARRTGKVPIHLRKEIFGFAANRLLDALCREAIFLAEHDYATAEEIDLAAEKALGHPMGPFRLMDLIGLDVIYLMWQEKVRESGRPEDGPPQSIAERYERGDLGRKTGRGWYTYPDG